MSSERIDTITYLQSPGDEAIPPYIYSLMSSKRTYTVDEIIEEMEARPTSIDLIQKSYSGNKEKLAYSNGIFLQRGILARLMLARKRIPEKYVKAAEFYSRSPDFTQWLYINIYNRIMDMDEVSIEKLISHFSAKKCATPGCEGDFLHSGSCHLCKEMMSEDEYPFSLQKVLKSWNNSLFYVMQEYQLAIGEIPYI